MGYPNFIIYIEVFENCLGLKACLPHGFDTLAEVVEDMAVFGPFTDVDSGFFGQFAHRYFALTHCFGEILAVGTATLNIVSYQFYMYCHFLYTFFYI